MKVKITVLAVLLIAVFLANFKFNNANLEKILINDVFPKEINGWHSEDIDAGKITYELIDKEELLFRKYKYKNTDKEIVLSIVLTEDRETIHDPQVCYKSQGIEMSNQKTFVLNGQYDVKYVQGIKNKEPYTIVYWFTDLNKTFPVRFNFMRHIAISKFLDKPLKGFAMVILMAPQDIEQDVIDLANEVNQELLRY